MDQVLARYRAMKHPGQEITLPELMSIGGATLGRGDIAAAEDAFERAADNEAGSKAGRGAAAEMAAYIAFMVGDATKTATLAKRSLALDASAPRLASWLLVWVDAAQGRRAQAKAELAKLQREQPDAYLAHVFVLAALGEWREALPFVGLALPAGHVILLARGRPSAPLTSSSPSAGWLWTVSANVCSRTSLGWSVCIMKSMPTSQGAARSSFRHSANRSGAMPS
jgi:hypothetical protein